MDQPGRPDDVRCWSKSGKHLFFQRISPFDPQATLVTPDKDQGDPNGHEARKICDDGQKGISVTFTVRGAGIGRFPFRQVLGPPYSWNALGPGTLAPGNLHQAQQVKLLAKKVVD